MGGWRRLPKRSGAVTVGYKCHFAWHSPSGGQWWGIGRAPWTGATPPRSNASLPLTPGNPGVLVSHPPPQTGGAIRTLTPPPHLFFTKASTL